MDINTEELKEHAPIIPYVKKYYKDIINITQETANVCFAQCIWHAEKTASLAFFQNGSYKCFGCGAHGDIISLVQNIENINFQEACKLIGDNVGYDIVLEQINPLFESYKDTMDNHNRRYWNNLQQNGEALRYLLFERGITKETIDLFRLGYTDNEEYKFRTDIGGISNRIVFPILEHKRKNAKCLGMAYRNLTNEKPKYINDINQNGREGQDPNLSGIFIKGDLLYGLSLAYDSIKKNNCIILVEGYFDVISLYQSGITNVVACMGTSLTINQINTISNLTKNVILFLDSDKAGITAMTKMIKDLYTVDLNVSVCVLNDSMDPADLCKYYNFDFNIIKDIIFNNIQQSIDFILNHSMKRYDNIITTERIKTLNNVMPIINEIKNEAIKELYKSKLYKRLDIN